MDKENHTKWKDSNVRKILKSYTHRFIEGMPHPKECLRQIDGIRKTAKEKSKRGLEWSICLTQMLLFLLEVYLQAVTDNSEKK